MSGRHLGLVHARSLPLGNLKAQDPAVISDPYAVAVDVFNRRRERLRELLEHMQAVELAQRSGVDATQISRYLYEPGRKGAKNIGEKTARKLEAGSGRPEGWLDRQHSGAGARAQVVAHQVSPMKIEHGPLIDWGVILKQEPLPPLFWTTLPDDSMAPRAPAGKRMCFDVSTPAKPGSGVLVRDSSGAVSFRRYVAGASGRWSAVPENTAYAPLDSERDGLKVLAVLVAEWGGWA